MDGPLFFPTRAHLLVCTGPRCRRRGAAGLFQRTWARLEARRLAYYRGGSLRLTESGCQGACAHGPNCIAYYAESGRPGLAEAWYSGCDDDRLAAVADALHEGRPPPADGRYDRG